MGERKAREDMGRVKGGKEGGREGCCVLRKQTVNGSVDPGL